MYVDQRFHTNKFTKCNSYIQMAAVMCSLCNSHIALQVPPLRRPRRGERSGGAGGTGGGGGGSTGGGGGGGGYRWGSSCPPPAGR